MSKTKLLEVFTPGLDIYVRYKVLDPTDVEAFVQKYASAPSEEYIRSVLEQVVFNLKSEVTEALKKLDKTTARAVLDNIYNGCVMLNPGFDVETWLRIADRNNATDDQENSVDEESMSTSSGEAKTTTKRTRTRKITKGRFLGLEVHLKSKVIGQNTAIEEVVAALKRQVAGLGDDSRPMGVFLFAGASGVGKTHLAKEVHSHLFGDDTELVRIDCGEYQHKHENQKLLGAPPGYLGHESGGHLTNAMMKNPNTVVLLDEVEKAHNDIWDTFLRVFDEGEITDSSGKVVSFKNAIIIMTTNLGNADTVRSMGGGEFGFGANPDADPTIPRRTLVERYAKNAIKKVFRPEFLNRIDKTVVFNHLLADDLSEIARLECDRIAKKLAKRGMSLTYSDSVIQAMIAEGVNPIEGARGLARIRRDRLENAISDTLLGSQRWPRGTIIDVTWSPETSYVVEARKPKRTASAKT